MKGKFSLVLTVPLSFLTSEVFKGVLFPNTEKNFVDLGVILNIQLFGNEVVLDIQISNPTLQFKKRVEDICIDRIKKFVK